MKFMCKKTKIESELKSTKHQLINTFCSCPIPANLRRMQIN